MDHRSDLWSICAVLYGILVGEPPFQGDNANALLHAISTKGYRPPSERGRPKHWQKSWGAASRRIERRAGNIPGS